MSDDCLYDALRRKTLQLEPLHQKEGQTIQKEWLNRFAQKVKAKKGKWVFRGLMWHGFSYGIQGCVEGHKARVAYKQQKLENFYLFDEDAERWYRCVAETFPDFSDYWCDIYIFPESMRWTMVFTHEDDCGPYFALVEA